MIRTMLRERIWIVGAAAFQELSEQKTRIEIGFSSRKDAEGVEIQQWELASYLQRELVNRFHADLLRLPMLGRADYQAMIETVISQMPENLRHAFRSVAERRVQNAIQTKKGARFIEEAIAETLRKVREIESKADKMPSIPFLPREASFTAE